MSPATNPELLLVTGAHLFVSYVPFCGDGSSSRTACRSGRARGAGAVGCSRALARSGYRHPGRHGRPARRDGRRRRVEPGRRAPARGTAAARRRPDPRRGGHGPRRRHRRRRRHRPRPLHRAARRPDDRRHLRIRARRPRARRLHAGRPRVRRRRRGRPLRRGDRRPPQGGLLGALQRLPHEGVGAVRRPARGHRRPGRGPACRRRGRPALPGRLPGRARPRARLRGGPRLPGRRTTGRGRRTPGPRPLYLRRPDAQVPKNYKVVTPQ